MMNYDGDLEMLNILKKDHWLIDNCMKQLHEAGYVCSGWKMLDMEGDRLTIKLEGPRADKVFLFFLSRKEAAPKNIKPESESEETPKNQSQSGPCGNEQGTKSTKTSSETAQTKKNKKKAGGSRENKSLKDFMEGLS